jgi:hypothetical protein
MVIIRYRLLFAALLLAESIAANAVVAEEEERFVEVLKIREQCGSTSTP